MPIRWTPDELVHMRSVGIMYSHLRGRKPILYAALASHFPNRSIEEVRSRFLYMERTNKLENQLRPSAFTVEESWMLHIAAKKFGGDFKLIREVYFRAFSEAKLKQRYQWQIANGWDDDFFAPYFPLLKDRDWEFSDEIVNEETWDGFLDFEYPQESQSQETSANPTVAAESETQTVLE